MNHPLIRTIIICLFLSPTSNFAAPTFQTAKPGCEPKCGNVTIPFPFGIGPAACFLDEWFEIVCGQTSTVPILRKLDLQVLDISLPAYSTANSTAASETTYGLHDGAVKVNLPIVRHQCGGARPSPPKVSLRSSPYSFSQPGNFFAAVGCNSLAVMVEAASTVVGCASRCHIGGLGNFSNCSGVGCCRTSIPSGLRAFDVKFKQISDDDAVAVGEECRFAFLADKQWLGFNGSKDLRVLRGMEYVPGVLEWGIPKEMVSEIGLSGSDSYGCEYYGESESKELPRLYRCYCRSGYDGNAYLEDCQDVDECEDPALNNCPWMCENRPGSYDCGDRDWMARFVAIGIVVGIVAIALLLLLWRLCRVMKRRKRRKQKERFFKRNGGILLKQQHSSGEGNHVGKGYLFNSKELEKATNNFSKERILGQGGQGTVYKGMLEDGRIVAIKKSCGMVANLGQVEQFINELVILSLVNHRNVVKLLGYCLETQLPLLVYEFIPNKTLSHYLHDHPKKELVLSWEMRLRIAAEVAGALSYLHSSASMPIYHRDIKSTNIMLDDKYRAKIADFGISKFVAIHQTHVTTQVRGTFGYLDPEYFQSCQFTDKSDVYSFGVVLAELLTGEMPISLISPEEYRGLATYFMLSMEENHLVDILDSDVLKQGKEEEIMAVAYLAKRCLDLKGKRRPSMKDVAMELERIRMLRNPSRNAQNHSGVDLSSNNTSWDDVWTSTRSDLDVDQISFPDVQPLLDIESW